MRSFSVAVLAPSLVVLNVIYPGESEVVGDACSFHNLILATFDSDPLVLTTFP